MGADGYIVDPGQPVAYEVRCYICSRTLYDGEEARDRHERCIGADGRLPVSVEIDNYEER